MRFTLFCIFFLCTITGAFASSTLTMMFGGLQRDFIVHLPAGYSSGQHLPLVFNFHGYGENATQHELYTNMDATADANNFIVVYPDGVNAQWNVGWFGVYGTGIDDVGFTSAMIDTLHLVYGIDLTRVYACGLSNGGFLSHRLACELSNRIAAVAPVAGTLTDSTAFYCTSTRKVPVMHVHGTADPIVPYNGLVGSVSVEQTIAFWTAKDQCANTTDTIFVPDTNIFDSSNVQKINYRTCSGGTDVLLYKIIGGGHTWPNAVINTTLGPTNRDLDGNMEIWNFFNRFTLNTTTGVEAKTKAVGVKIYSNPFTDEIRIEADENIGRIELLDMAGHVIMVKEIQSSVMTITPPKLNAGIYLLKITSGNFSCTEKILRD